MESIEDYERLNLGRPQKPIKVTESEEEKHELDEQSDDELDLGIEMDDEEMQSIQNKLMEYTNIFGVSLKPTKEMKEIIAMNPSELHVANLAAESQIAQLMDEGTIQRFVYLIASKVLDDTAAIRLAENSFVIPTIKALAAFKLVKLPHIIRIVFMLALTVLTNASEIPHLNAPASKKRKVK